MATSETIHNPPLEGYSLSQGLLVNVALSPSDALG